MALGRYYWPPRVFPLMSQKPWFNQFVALSHLFHVFQMVLFGQSLVIWMGIAARVTATWTVVGAVLVITYSKVRVGTVASVTVTWTVAGAVVVDTLAKVDHFLENVSFALIMMMSHPGKYAYCSADLAKYNCYSSVKFKPFVSNASWATSVCGTDVRLVFLCCIISISCFCPFFNLHPYMQSLQKAVYPS